MFSSDGPTDSPAVPGPGREGAWPAGPLGAGAGPAAEEFEAPAAIHDPVNTVADADVDTAADADPETDAVADSDAVAEPPRAAPVPSADEEFLAAMAAEFDAIEASLVRLDDGTFDTCQVCGGRIGQDRLIADPVTTRCPAHR